MEREGTMKTTSPSSSLPGRRQASVRKRFARVQSFCTSSAPGSCSIDTAQTEGRRQPEKRRCLDAAFLSTLLQLDYAR